MPHFPFKLIAIKPLADCATKYLKVLQEDTVYPFYRNYTISGDADQLDTISINTDFVPDIYDIGDIKVNISAVVGTNGAGKSSLVELLYICLYNVSYHLGLLEESKKEFKNLKHERGVSVAIYYELDNAYYRLTIKETAIRLGRFDERLVLTGLGEKLTDKTQLNQLFYSIVINYSQYALNSSESRNYWLNAIFHKNDGYQTPIVINPYRDKGNVDINTENFLVRSRLLANIMEGVAESLLFNGNEKVPSQLAFTFIENKFKPKKTETERSAILSNWEFRWKTLQPFLEATFGAFERNIDLWEIDQYAKRYILLKMESMSRKYATYDEFKQFYTEEHRALVQPFLERIRLDSSHTAYKFKQALNFLRFHTMPEAFWNFVFDKIRLNALPVSDVRQAISKIQKDNPDIPTIELIPPSFLYTDIVFENDNSRFSQLSSGEKQKIYALASLVYHLKNLNSVEPDVMTQSPEKRLVKYSNINIIFDEVELYYHPDLQRRFVKDIIDNIRVAAFQGISAINFLFITHSPFILSDIPNENILYLDVRNHKSEIRHIDQLTLGGNIHDLLASSFFMQEDGFMGEFARGIVLNLYKYLQAAIQSQGQINPDTVWEKWTAVKALAVINRLGEPLVQASLQEMFLIAFPGYEGGLIDGAIDAQIERLQRLKQERKRR